MSVALAGCGDTGPGQTSTALFVTNELAEPQSVTLRIFELPGTTDDETAETADLEDGPEVLLAREQLDPDEEFTIDAPDLSEGWVRVRIVTAAIEGSHDWFRRNERSTLDVRLQESGVRFTELD